MAKTSKSFLSPVITIFFDLCESSTVVPIVGHGYWKILAFGWLTSSVTQPVKFLGWKKHTHTCRQYIFQSCNNSTLNTHFEYCVLMKILSHTNAKKKTKTFRITNFTLLLDISKWHHGNERVNWIQQSNRCLLATLSSNPQFHPVLGEKVMCANVSPHLFLLSYN